MTRCKWCRRPALFRQPKTGQVKADDQHDLCQRCWRDLKNRVRSRKGRARR